jgi:hypothetical protein
MWYVDYLALLPAALAAVTKDDPVAYVRENFRPKSADVVCEALALERAPGEDAEAALTRFVLANVVQGFLAPSKQDRVDDKERKMKIADVGSVAAQEELLHGFVAAQYANQYRRDVVAKQKRERKELVEELVRRLVAAPSVDEFCALLSAGLTRGPVSDLIKDVSHAGYVPLRDALTDLSADVPLRLRKLAVLALGRNERDEVVFNSGNVVVKGFEAIETAFLSLGETAQLDALRARWRQFVAHVYRANGMPNRHSHCGDKPSYFALGYPTLEAMAAAVSAKEMDEYYVTHWNCCGVPQLKGLCVSLKERLRLTKP